MRWLCVTMIAAMMMVGIGCAHCPIVSHCVFGELPHEKIEASLKGNALGPQENFKITPLGKDEQCSYHLVQIRDRERLHRHNTHDGYVRIWEGSGNLLLGDKTIALKKGDEVKIPKGVAHAFTNTYPNPSVAVVQFTPAFDGKDTEYLE